MKSSNAGVDRSPLWFQDRAKETIGYQRSALQELIGSLKTRT